MTEVQSPNKIIAVIMTAQDCRNVCLSVPIRTLALTGSVKLFELFTVP